MEIKEAERVIVSKPVASRPNSFNFRSFSSSNVCCETTAAAAIRPKTVRFKPNVGRPLATEHFDDKEFSSHKTEVANASPIVVYKPQAKLVSKTAVSFLASVGNLERMAPFCGESKIQGLIDEESINLESSTSMIRQDSYLAAEKSSQPTNYMSQAGEDDAKMLSYAANCDRPSYDGYNWRKYGQKQVKGSEYPRSYYKCTYPNCPVKKKVERSFDGKIAEIVYNGEHNHSKPHPVKRNIADILGTNAFGYDDNAAKDSTNIPGNNTSERHDHDFEAICENPTDTASRNRSATPPNDYARAGLINTKNLTPENSCGNSGECDVGNKEQVEDVAETRCKRRKRHTQQEGCLVVQSSIDSESMGDGFRWRKYGQKVVKGNPYPRSYYRCTSSKCNVRKHVERALDDPTAFITTYEGKHNHEMPAVGSTSDAASPGHLGKEKH